MNENSLTVEGDVNFTDERTNWYKVLDTSTLALLADDADLFIHQALSTPCINVVSACEGAFVTDIEGNKFMDFHGNNVHQLGYRNPYIVNRVKEQLDLLPFCPRRYTNMPAIEFARKLTSLFPGDLKRVLFAPGGTSAVGIALKLARVVTGKYKVVSLTNSFHGASLDAIAAGGEEQFKKYMGPLHAEAVNIPQPEYYRSVLIDGQEDSYAKALEDILQNDKNIGAFIAETVRNTDVQIPSVEYWRAIREICNKYNVLLILDEIPIAFGRTGKMFAFEHYDIEPDIVCLGKGLGAGIIPFAAVVSRSAYNIAADISLGHYTHEKSPLGSVAALAMIEYIEKENLLEKVREKEEFMRSHLNHLRDRYAIIGDVRGIGLLWG